MALLRIALLKLVRRPATWIVFAILAGLIALVFLSLGATAGSMQSMGDEFQVRVLLDFPTAYTIVAGFVLAFGGLLGVAYGAAIIGADWAWGTIRAIVARGESRVRYTLVTFLAITLVIGVGITIASIIGIGSAIAGAEMAGLGSDGATDQDTLRTLPELRKLGVRTTPMEPYVLLDGQRPHRQLRLLPYRAQKYVTIEY